MITAAITLAIIAQFIEAQAMPEPPLPYLSPAAPDARLFPPADMRTTRTNRLTIAP